MSTTLWPACASRFRRVRGSPLEVNLTETNNSLPIESDVLLQSSRALSKANSRLLKSNAETVRPNHELLPGIAAKPGASA